MLDPSALAPAKEGQTLPRLVRRLGAYDVTTPRGRGSEEFGPLQSRPSPEDGLEHVTASCAWEHRIRTSGMKLARQGPLFAARPGA
jgi:hypothetical protein